MSLADLSRRERQIMEIVYGKGMATAAEVREELEDSPSYSAVRAALSLLVKKKRLKHRRVGLKYVFEPTVAREEARGSVLKKLVQTFFDNSTESVVATLLGSKELKVSDAELDRMEKLIREAKRRRAS